MKLFAYLAFSLLFLIACNEAGHEALSLVKQEKVSFETNVTWADYVMQWSKDYKDESFNWKTRKVDSFIEVAFTSDRDFGLFWMVDVNRKSCVFLNGRNFLSKKYGYKFTIDSTTYPITDLKHYINCELNGSDFVKINFETSSILRDDPGIYVTCEGKIRNLSGKDLNLWNLTGEVSFIYEDKVISEGIKHIAKFDSDNEIWKNGDYKYFKVITKRIDTIYANYQPVSIDFILSLKAEDPIGYLYGSNIYFHDFINDWKNLKSAENKTQTRFESLNNSTNSSESPYKDVWDKELDVLENEQSTVYKNVYNSSTPQQQVFLKKSQQEWIKNYKKKCYEDRQSFSDDSTAHVDFCQCKLEELEKRIEFLKARDF